MSNKVKYIISILLAIGISVPIAQLIIGPMTDTGGMIQVATNATSSMSIAGGTLDASWELVAWRIMPIIFLIGGIVYIVRAMGKRSEDFQ